MRHESHQLIRIGGKLGTPYVVTYKITGQWREPHWQVFEWPGRNNEAKTKPKGEGAQAIHGLAEFAKGLFLRRCASFRRNWEPGVGEDKITERSHRIRRMTKVLASGHQ